MSWKQGFLILSAAMCAVLACTPATMRPIAKDRCGLGRPGHDDDIREVVFRELFPHDFSGHGRNAAVYFIEVDSGKLPGAELCCWDPSDDLLGRFRSHTPPVKPVSAGLPLRMANDTLSDPERGQAAVLFSTRSLCWVSDSEVEVEAESWIDALGSRDYRYTVVFKSGKWVVTSEELTGVS